jgi:hypothetical protein
MLKNRIAILLLGALLVASLVLAFEFADISTAIAGCGRNGC